MDEDTTTPPAAAPDVAPTPAPDMATQLATACDALNSMYRTFRLASASMGADVTIRDEIWRLAWHLRRVELIATATGDMLDAYQRRKNVETSWPPPEDDQDIFGASSPGTEKPVAADA